MSKDYFGVEFLNSLHGRLDVWCRGEDRPTTFLIQETAIDISFDISLWGDGSPDDPRECFVSLDCGTIQSKEDGQRRTVTLRLRPTRSEVENLRDQLQFILNQEW